MVYEHMHSRAPINVARCGNRVGTANGQARAPINVVLAQVLAPIRGALRGQIGVRDFRLRLFKY